MSDNVRPPGKTTIAPEVLVSIARLTVLDVPGVSYFAAVPVNVNRLLKKEVSEGIRIEVENNTVYADLYVVIEKDYNAREVSRNIQQQLARAISDMVGMEVGKVNIHIEDIEYSSTPTRKS